MKKVAGRLRLDLAQYRELEAFAQFGSGSTRRPRARSAAASGWSRRNQPQYQPWPAEEQVVAIYAGINGWLDKVPVGQVRASTTSCASTCAPRARSSRRSADPATSPTRRREAQGELEHFQGVFNVEEEGLAG